MSPPTAAPFFLPLVSFLGKVFDRFRPSVPPSFLIASSRFVCCADVDGLAVACWSGPGDAVGRAWLAGGSGGLGGGGGAWGADGGGGGG